MEWTCPSFSILLTVVLFLFMLLKIRKRFKSFDKTFHLPPGPLKLLVIGNMHLLVGSLPHHRLIDLARKYGPFMHLQLGEVSTVVVSSPEFAKEVMKTYDVSFASRPEVLLRDLAKKYGPFMHLHLREIAAVIISSPKFAKEVMRIHDVNFASRPQILVIEILSYDSTNLVLHHMVINGDS
ncbi:cytochrome P450 71D9-like [Pistacia vera]|uniref:cytochrome P450 71D9-like n=1 Tax=Pistacia vera TaxID=55513 RepID=UPI001263AE96|nr:cytochrome P450 71D9-like [Pistacia vera]